MDHFIAKSLMPHRSYPAAPSLDRLYRNVQGKLLRCCNLLALPAPYDFWGRKGLCPNLDPGKHGDEDQGHHNHGENHLGERIHPRMVSEPGHAAR